MQDNHEGVDKMVELSQQFFVLKGSFRIKETGSKCKVVILYQ